MTGTFPGPEPAAPGPGTDRQQRACVVLLTGPSGAGKSRLAARLHRERGWPVLRLDDFYREHDDPGLPRSPIGIPDWDHPDSWNEAAALEAVATLVTTGSVEAPEYDISTSSVTGYRHLTAEPGDLVVAEGLFAARLIDDLRAADLLRAGYCVRTNRYLTAVRRLLRDLAERRKPPLVLLRRGWSLLREEPRVIAEAERLGASCATPAQVHAALTATPAGCVAVPDETGPAQPRGGQR